MSKVPPLERLARGAPEAFIGHGEVVTLREELLWPVADQIWRGDFWAESVPGEGRTLDAVSKGAGQVCRATIEISCFSRHAASGLRNERAITVEYAVPQPELTKPLYRVAKDSACCKVDRWGMKDSKKGAMAWLSHSYEFSTVPDAGLVTVSNTFELRTRSGSLMWDDTDMPSTEYMGDLEGLEADFEMDENRLTRAGKGHVLQVLGLHGLIALEATEAGNWQWVVEPV